MYLPVIFYFFTLAYFLFACFSFDLPVFLSSSTVSLSHFLLTLHIGLPFYLFLCFKLRHLPQTSLRMHIPYPLHLYS